MRACRLLGTLHFCTVPADPICCSTALRTAEEKLTFWVPEARWQTDGSTVFAASLAILKAGLVCRLWKGLVAG